MSGLTTFAERPRTAHADAVLRMIFDANRADAQRGIYSICSAHRLVLEAACEAARADGSPLLIEATCNQVNHLGGYTGMTPADFRRDVDAIARRCGLAPSALVLGGDHLGPNPWRHRRAADAMREAGAMVAAMWKPASKRSISMRAWRARTIRCGSTIARSPRARPHCAAWRKTRRRAPASRPST
ncbi:D-tagatose-1,6-bisphosphate aldolase subunit KbaZ [Burkholderia cepacia]|nr:D-tagatose-1,6-bisphosphate aldolase subunit KbaZ [Burkholderia cepacia]